MTQAPSSSDAPASLLARFFLQEDLNFLLTNRLPRRAATQLFGWYSRLESPALTRFSIAVWQHFAGDLRLHEARAQRFRSLRECFVRELAPGARPLAADPDVLVCPCDAQVGAHGRVQGATVYQAKGFPYTLRDLLGDAELEARHRDGFFLTLRLKSSFYHRFHAPCDARLRRLTYQSGDTWNVNPIALRRVERLFCKNERAVLELQTPSPREALTLVPVASILVASLRFRAVPVPLDLEHRGRRTFELDVPVHKGEELGHFESGSTVVLFARGPFRLAEGVREGALLRMGEPLLQRVRPSPEGPHGEKEGIA